jgi:rhodanese-related sulfurtransferase
MVARFQEFTMRLMRLIVLCVLALSAGLAVAQKVDPAKVPEEQRSKLGLYVLPKETPPFIKAQGGKVMFLDVRTRAEAQFMGMADGVDALVPYVEFQEFMTDWDDNRGFYKLEPFSDFAPEVERRLKAKGLTKNDTILLICRAGERSSRAADLLQSLGYTKVYTVLNGFEGELSAKGRRNVNGWKNDGLPWSYDLDRKKMYFPR